MMKEFNTVLNVSHHACELLAVKTQNKGFIVHYMHNSDLLT